jgi:hypothetical protein
VSLSSQVDGLASFRDDVEREEGREMEIENASLKVSKVGHARGGGGST